MVAATTIALMSAVNFPRRNKSSTTGLASSTTQAATGIKTRSTIEIISRYRAPSLAWSSSTKSLTDLLKTMIRIASMEL